LPLVLSLGTTEKSAFTNAQKKF